MYYIFFETLLLVVIVYMLFSIFYYKMKFDCEAVSPYECGFDLMSQSRSVFSYRFFLISILFIIFDVEISLMLPVPFLIDEMFSVWIFILFILVLIVGLLYEYNNGVLNWLDEFIPKA